MNSCRINRSHYNDSGLTWVFSVSEKVTRYSCPSLSDADAGRHHSSYAELRSKIGSSAAFRRVSGETRVQHNV